MASIRDWRVSACCIASLVIHCLGGHFTVSADVDVPSSEAICRVSDMTAAVAAVPPPAITSALAPAMTILRLRSCPFLLIRAGAREMTETVGKGGEMARGISDVMVTLGHHDEQRRANGPPGRAAVSRCGFTGWGSGSWRDSRSGRRPAPSGIGWWSGRFWWVAVEQPGVADLLVRCLENEGVTSCSAYRARRTFASLMRWPGRRSATSWSATSRRRRSWPRSTGG